MIPVYFQGKQFNITVTEVYAPTSNAKEDEVEWFYEPPTRPSRTNTKKYVLLVTGDWNIKVGSQEILGGTGKFGLGEQNKAGQRPTEFYQEDTLVIANPLQQHKR